MSESLKARTFKILSIKDQKDVTSRLFNWAIVALILLNVIASLLESIDSINVRFDTLFDALKDISTVLFCVEYMLRVWSCTEHRAKLFKRPVSGRLHYMLTPLMLIDLLVVISLVFNLTPHIDLRSFRLFRLLNIFKITRNSPAMQLLFTVLRRESNTLVSIFTLIAIILILISTVIYAIEHQAQPRVFASIPHSMWWTIATLTTVGYGDAVPITPLGKFFGMFVMFVGVAMFAIPTGILVSSFYQEIKRKDFIATWELVAQVPFFSQLTAKDIGEIADLLRLHIGRAGETIFKQGDEADSMYFIVSGEVLINDKSILRGGDFFGEIGILYKIPRMATVRAKTYVELLQLNLRDMELFLESHPQLRNRILELAEQRKAINP